MCGSLKHHVSAVHAVVVEWRMDAAKHGLRVYHRCFLLRPCPMSSAFPETCRKNIEILYRVRACDGILIFRFNNITIAAAAADAVTEKVE